MTFKGSKPLRAAKGIKPLALGRGHTKCSPGIIDVEENIPLTMRCLHTKTVGDQQRKGDASLELTGGQIEKTLVLEGEDGTGGSYDKPSVLIDNRENAALTRKVRKQARESQLASLYKDDWRSAKEGGDASLELTSGQSEWSLVSEGEGRAGGSHRKPLALIDDGENAALTRIVSQGREMQTLNSPTGKVNSLVSEGDGGDGGSQGEMLALTVDGENVALIRKFEKAKRNLINV
ncbi:hypothetical protein BKA82DRAFT_4015127 [Pisolithus tinctorius]|nr:hypothetical protein BKA82DRAFT_4018201 [Pisolithus tinctorius]KAI6148068.1 hypothetical protein BKA82DRAFT_4015127 [Pisolithus tinctorius]